MANRSRIISDNPIGNGLADFQNLTLDLLSALRNLLAARQLASKTSSGAFRSDFLKLIFAAASDDFDFNRVKPFLNAAFAKDPNDALIWDQVYHAIAVAKSTPLPRPIPSSLQQTPWLHNTGSFANSSEYRQDVDRVLRSELGPLYVGLPRFRETFFGRVAGLNAASKAVLKNAKESDVLAWFNGIFAKLDAFVKNHRPTPTRRRKPLAQLNKPIQGSTGKRKLDVGLVDDPDAGKDSRCRWSQILVPGKLKSNRSADIALKAWLDLGRYARKVFAAQNTRRFVLGFTFCGPFIRLWEFNRLGGIASDKFDINKNGLQFVSTIFGFLWISEEDLGFDPTIVKAKGQRFIVIERNGQTKRLVIDELMARAPCIAGRATTCWKAHREGDPQIQLVIKDSWQYTERDEERDLLQKATDKGVVNVARYYHHETV
ncbi:hypothetical protein RB596_000174 [Gaeumannomyces avenae]